MGFALLVYLPFGTINIFVLTKFNNYSVFIDPSTHD